MSALLANSLSKRSSAVRAPLKSFLASKEFTFVNSVATVLIGVADVEGVDVGVVAIGAGVEGSYPALFAAEIGKIMVIPSR